MSYTIVIEGTYSRPLAGPLGWLEFKDFLDSVNDDDFVHTKELVNYGRNQALPQLRRELEELLQRDPNSAVALTIRDFIDAIDSGPFGALVSEITRSSAPDNGQSAAAPEATAADLESMMPSGPASSAPVALPSDDEPEEMSEGITLEHPEIPPVVHVEPRPPKTAPAAPAVSKPAAKPMKKAAKAAPAKAAPAKKAAAKSAPAKKAAAKKTVKKAAKKPVVKKAAKKVVKKVTAVKKAAPAKKAAPKKAAAKKMALKKTPLKKSVAKKAPPKKAPPKKAAKKAPPRKAVKKVVKAVKKAVKKPAKRK